MFQFMRHHLLPGEPEKVPTFENRPFSYSTKVPGSSVKPAAHGEENAQQSGMNVILLSKILAVCG